MNNNKGINVLSCFDGMACGRIALERAGVEVDNYYASEIDKYAIQIANKNYPDTKHIGSVIDVRANNLPKIDLLIGGSPCQGFSFAGKQLNFEDERSKLFFEYVRLLKECKPKYFLLENVKMKKEYQDVITAYLGVKPILMNSSLVSAQNRERLYWTNIPNVEAPGEVNIYLKDILELNADIKYDISEAKKERVLTSKRGKGFFYDESNNKIGCLIAGYYKEPTDGSYLNFENRFRKLTPIECERLQTVPGNYTEGISNSQRYKMLGNGWTVDIIAHIFRRIRE